MDEQDNQEDQLNFRLLKPSTKKNSDEAGEVSIDEKRTSTGPSSPNVSLNAGMPLPPKYRKQFPSHLFGVPIEEIDDFYKDKQTFVVISSNWEIHRFSNVNSLSFLNVFNRFRWLAIRTVNHKLFRYLLILVMLVYTIKTYATFGLNEKTQIDRHIFLAVFNVELNLKLIAYGAIRHPFSYFRSGWNWLDFITIVVMTTITFVPNTYPLLYALESIRALKWIQLFPLAKSTFSNILQSINYLKELLTFFVFFFAILTIFTLTTFHDTLRNTCVSMGELETSAFNINDLSFCGNVSGSRPCPENYVCLADAGQNPNFGYTNFDHFGFAALQVLRLLTRDHWDNLYYYLKQVNGPTSTLVFLANVIFFGFLFNNLLAAYISVRVGKFKTQLEGQKQYKTQKANSTRQAEVANTSEETENDIQLFVQSNKEEVPENPDEIKQVEVEGPNESEEKSNEPEEKENDSKGLPEKKSWISKIFSGMKSIVCDWSCCCSCYARVQDRLSKFLFHRYFEYYIYGLIIFSAVIVSLEHLHMSLFLRNFADLSTLVVFLLYAVEAFLKILALTPRKYFQDEWNRLDFFIVTFVQLDMFIDSGSSYFIILRVFRFGRIWKRLHFIFKIHQLSIGMAFAIMWTLAGIGKYTFGPHYIIKSSNSSSSMPRWTFVTQTDAFTNIFRAFSGKWIECLWDCLTVVDTHWMVYLYFITIISIGYILVTNLFVNLVVTCLNTNVLLNTDHMISQRQSPSLIQKLAAFITRKCCHRTNTSEPIPAENHQDISNITSDEARVEIDQIAAAPQSDVIGNSYPLNPCCCDWCCLPFLRPSQSSSEESGWIKMRIMAHRWAKNSLWNALITLTIILSCIPFVLSANPNLTHLITNWIISIIFVLELILNLAGDGCKTYFGNSWSRFDFIIVLTHLILNGYLGKINAVRVLRLISRIQRIRVVADALMFQSSILREILHVFLIVWFMFAYIGTGHFMGAYFHCVDADMNTMYHVSHHYECEENNTTWINSHLNFDNILHSLSALFHVATLKGWMKQVPTGDDDNGLDAHMINTYFPLVINWFLMGFVLMGSFACLACIVAAFIIKINEQKKQIGGGYIEILMNDSQRKQLAAQRKQMFLSPAKLLTPCNTKVSKCCARIVYSPMFKGTITMLLLVNFITLALTLSPVHHTKWHRILITTEFAILLGFTLEIILKLIVFKKKFFQSKWNIYDFTVIALAFAMAMLAGFAGLVLLSREFLGILIVLRLVRCFPWVRRVLQMIHICTPAIHNVMWFLNVVVFFFAVTANQLYYNVELPDLYSFKTFGSSFTLFAELALDGEWDRVYDALAEQGHIATAFFLNFLFILYFICISSGTIIFMENYHRLYEYSRLNIDDSNLENFTNTWQIFDPKATGYIAFTDLSTFMHYLEPPFQICTPNEERIAEMEFPVNKENRVKFSDVLGTILHHLDKEKQIPKPVLIEDADVLNNAAESLSRRLHVFEKNRAPKLWDRLFKDKEKREENQNLTTEE